MTTKDFVPYQTLCGDITQEFAAISRRINEIEQTLLSISRQDIAKLIRDIQNNEKEKLQLVRKSSGNNCFFFLLIILSTQHVSIYSVFQHYASFNPSTPSFHYRPRFSLSLTQKIWSKKRTNKQTAEDQILRKEYYIDQEETEDFEESGYKDPVLEHNIKLKRARLNQIVQNINDSLEELKEIKYDIEQPEEE